MANFAGSVLYINSRKCQENYYKEAGLKNECNYGHAHFPVYLLYCFAAEYILLV